MENKNTFVFAALSFGLAALVAADAVWPDLPLPPLYILMYFLFARPSLPIRRVSLAGMLVMCMLAVAVFRQVSAPGLQERALVSFVLLALALVSRSRERAELLIRDKGNCFRLAADNAPFGCAIYDSQRRYTYVNPRLASMLGLSPESMRGRKDEEIFPKEISVPLISGLRKTKETGKLQSFDLTMGEGAEKKVFLVEILPIMPGNSFGSIGMVLNDKTPQIRSEEALRSSRELAELLNSINVVITSTLNAEEIMRQVVKMVARGIGADTAAIDMPEGCFWVPRYAIGFPEWQTWPLFTDEDLPITVLAAKTREPVAIEDTLSDPRLNYDNMRKWNIRSLMTIPLVNEDKLVGVIGLNFHAPAVFSQDQLDFAKKISNSVALALRNAMFFKELQEHEKALRAGEKKLRMALQAAQSGWWEWDIALDRITYSETLGDLLGFKYKQCSLNDWVRCIHRQEQERFIREIGRQAAEGSELNLEFRAVHPVLGPRWILMRGDFAGGQAGERRALAMCVDITERKEAEEVLRRDRETFEKLVQERTKELIMAQLELEKSRRLSDIGELAATVAHELRNPLGVIRAAAYNIKRKLKGDSVQAHLENIEKKIVQSDQIINNLLFYSRLRKPEFEQVTASSVIKEAIEGFKRRFPDFLIKEQLGDIAEVPIECDPLQLGELFVNLISNAHDAVTESGGRLLIAASKREHSIAIDFSDNGCGIPAEIIPNVFMPFYSTKSKGTGLGLTVCKQIVELHKGRIWIESTVNEGTTVSVEIPIRQVVLAAR